MDGVDCLSTVFNTQTALIISDVLQAECWSIWQENDLIRSWMGAPLLMNEEVMGVLTVDSFATNNYSVIDLANLQVFANHAAVAIYNARLYSLAQQANEQLVKLNADKDKFFSIVAHDLKGPFLPLLGNLELMEEMASRLNLPTMESMSAASHRSARRVFELLENLLYWARLQMGRMEYTPQRLDLSVVAAKTIELLADNAKIKQINLFSQFQPQTWVYADENMLDTIIRNLINNALKFTPLGGQVTISAQDSRQQTADSREENSSTSYLLPSTHYIEVSIADTGVGMPPQVKEKLFKLNQHVTTIGTGKETGTGLGLIICQEMVAKSGGRIWVESEVGQGTTVRFTVLLDGV
jgi:signal transduction histidine kinase